MRWLIRRSIFYVFALWVAITLNFLLPRLMPGDPAGGVLQRLSSSQLASNPGLIQTYRDLLGGPKQALLPAYWDYLHRVVTFNFGISTTNYPTKVSTVIGQTLPYSIFLVGVAFLLAFILGITVGMVAAWRRGGVVDNIVVPTMLSISAFPAFFSSLVAVYVLGLKLAGGWVLNMRTVMINTIEEDYVSMALAKGVSDRRVMTAYAGRNAILPPLNGFAAQFATAVGGLVFIEFVFSYPGAGFTLQQAALGSDYPLTQGLLLVFAVCVILANFIMDLLNLVLDPRVRAS
jgi:peptide/nickel transport system permease protein